MKKTVLALTVAASLTLPVFSPTTLAESVAWDQAEQQWLTQESDHFLIHFRSEHQAQAARSLDIAEQVHSELTSFFGYQPEEKTEIVIVDEFDYSNGWATVFPYPQIRLYMSPPNDVNGLESNDEWLHLLIRHEYVHIMHLEMGGGAPEFLRNIFGRNVLLYPHALTPSMMLEGLAVYLETNEKLGYGRLQGSSYAMQMRMEVASGEWKNLNQVVVANREFPLGYQYLYGAYFVEFLVNKYGEDKVQQFLTDYSRRLLPFFLLNRTARNVFGDSFEDMWPEFEASVQRHFTQQLTQLEKAKVSGVQIGQTVPFMQVVSASSDKGILFNVRNGEDRDEIVRYQSSAELATLTPSKGIVSLTSHPKSGLIVSRLVSYADGRGVTDLFAFKDGKWQRITERERFREVRWLPSGNQVIASRNVDGLSELWLLNPEQAENKQLIWRGNNNEVLGGFDVSPNGEQVVASIKRAQQGWNLEQYDLGTKQWRKITNSKSVENSPAYVDSETVVYSADYDGIFNIYQLNLNSGKASQLTREIGGAFNPIWSEELGLIYQSYDSQGYTMRRLAQPESLNLVVVEQTNAQYNYPDPAPNVALKSEAESYTPWSSLRPRTWVPVYSLDENQSLAGIITNGSDALGRHNYLASLAWDTENSLAEYSIGYLYDNRWRVTLSRNHDFTTFKQDGRESKRIEQNDSALIQRNHLFNAFEDQFSIAAGLYWERESEAKAPSFAVRPYVELEETLVGLAASFDNRESYLNVMGVGWGHYMDLTAETNDLLSSDYEGNKYQGQWKGTFDLPGRSTIALRLAGGISADTAKPFRLGGSDTSDELALFGRETQGLRGYDETVQSGNHYFTQRVEFSTWLARVERNWGLYPVGLGDISATLFADSGSAWNDEGSYEALTGIGVSTTIEMRLGYNLNLPITLGYASGLDDELGKNQFFLSVSGNF
ncbi:WD-40 repeat-containing protein [Vibrio sinaloensis DSM 21326]|uniref:WD-40 repeat-containing protein n=1 Tax=Vibrio sinaloensis DSM 21326 TaxID=945550 RepID=E8M5A9_PHOS4|nr:hypothetical protein [Vibrio sinaloensis]EGA70702.1 WD-40 repeat-containing protein [Vibrio sinaloensis DSM 21326]